MSYDAKEQQAQLQLNGSAEEPGENASGDGKRSDENGEGGDGDNGDIRGNAACNSNENRLKENIKGGVDEEQKEMRDRNESVHQKEGGVNNEQEEEEVEFEQEPFVQAAAQFQCLEFKNILELLARALDKGLYVMHKLLFSPCYLVCI